MTCNLAQTDESTAYTNSVVVSITTSELWLQKKENTKSL